MLSGMPWFLLQPIAAICERTPNLTTQQFDILEDRGIFGVDLMVLRDHLWSALRGETFPASQITDLADRLENSPPGTIDTFCAIFNVNPSPYPKLTPAARTIAALHFVAGKGLS